MIRAILASLGFSIATVPALCQVQGTPPQRGILPNSVYSVSDMESINLRSGNLSLQVPLAALPPGPGGNGLQVGLSYNSQIYDLEPQPAGSSLTQKLIPSTTGGGWKYNFQYALVEEQRPPGANGQADCSDTTLEHQYKQHLVFPDGSRHLLRMDVPVPTSSHYSQDARPSTDDYNLYNVDGRSVCFTSFLDTRPTLYSDDGTYVRVVTRRVYQFTGSVAVTTGASSTTTSVTLTATGVPNGWNVTFNPNTVSLTGPTALTQSTVTVTAPDNVSSGTYRIGILGTGNGSPSTAETAVTVTIPGAVFAPDSISLPAVPAAAQPFNISTEWGAITSHTEPSWVTVTYPGTCKGSPGNDYACVTAAETSSAREGTIEVHFSGATANVFVRQEAPVPATGFGVSATGGVTKALAWTAYFPDGRTVEGFGGQTSRIVDRNGNAVSVTGYFDPASTGSFPEVIVADQVNRRVKISHQWNAVPNDASISQDIVTREYCSSGTCAPGDGAWQANQTWMVTWKAYQANYSHNYAGGQNWTVCGTPCGLIPHGTWVQSVALPPAVAGETARTYQFVYNLEGSAQGVNGWGELYSVTTPTGYTATYRYSGGNESSPRAGSFPLTWSPVTSKTASYTDGNPSEMWSYSFGGGTGDTTTVTAPDGSTSQTHYLSYPVMNPLAWKTVAPNGDVVKRLWYSNRPPNVSLAGQFPNAYLKTEYHFINASNSLRAASILDYSYDKNNNLLSLGEYDCLPADERLTPCAPVPTDATVQPGALPAGLAPTRQTVHTYAAATDTADIGTSDPVSAQGNAYWASIAPRLLNARRSKSVTGSGTARYSEYTYDDERGRGNLTQELAYDGSNAIRPFKADYDTYGNVTNRYDAKGNITHYEYGSIDVGNSCLNSYPTAVTVASSTADALRTTTTWNCAQGLPVDSTDPNQLKTHREYDILGRPTLVRLETGSNEHNTQMQYSDALRQVVTTSPLDATRNLVTTETYDSQGRLASTLVPSGTCGYAHVDHYYQTPAGGGFSYEAVSNPYCSTGEATMGWTRTRRDPNGRVVEVATYPGATPPAPWTPNYAGTPTGVTTMDYSGGNTVVTTDPAGIRRRTRSDGLGRLVEVVEDPGPGSDRLAYATVYGYDQGDQLTQVTQTRKAAGVDDATQTRTFAYDSLGRLRTATNPESGPTGYTYDANGNVTLVTLSDGVTRSYEYNARNQVTRKSYSPATTPATIYCYDGRLAAKESTGCGNVTVGAALGRLTGVGTKVGTGAPAEALVTNYTGLDWMGRVVSSEQWVDGRQYALGYGYLLGGPREYVVYPSGRRVNYTYDAAGRAEKTWTGVAGSTCSGAGCYASNVTYTAGGAMLAGTFGTLGQTWEYNSRQQVEHITVRRDGAVKWKLDNGYPASGNNGNVTSQTVDATGAGGVSRTAAYHYDRLNRLDGVTEEGGGVAQGYGYDSVGNRWLATYSNWQPSSFTPAGPAWYEGATNRMANAAVPVVQGGRGNLTAMGGYGLEYDAEDREVKATLGQNYAQYWYDGEGRRVKKLEQRETAEGTTVTTTVYVYDAGGEMVAEYGSGGGGSGLQYLVADHLGSTRLVVGAQMSCHDYTPFGEEIGAGVGGRNECYGTGDGVTQKFTGKERGNLTTEGGLDYFGARYFSAAMGRFTSVDPGPYDLRNPQTLNRYTYANNNPLAYVDRDGRVASYAVDRKKHTITVTVNIVITGPGANATTARALTRKIENAWKGTYKDKKGVEWTITTKASVEVYDPLTGPLLAKSGYAPPNSLRIAPDIGRAFFDEPRMPDGYWSGVPHTRSGQMNSSLKAAAHEAGHMLGLGDDYYEDTMTAVPGHETHLMGGASTTSTHAGQDELDKLGGYVISTGQSNGTIIWLPGELTSTQRAQRRSEGK